MIFQEMEEAWKRVLGYDIAPFVDQDEPDPSRSKWLLAPDTSDNRWGYEMFEIP